MMSVKQGGITYLFLSFWYDLNSSLLGHLYIYIYIKFLYSEHYLLKKGGPYFIKNQQKYDKKKLNILIVLVKFLVVVIIEKAPVERALLFLF